MTTHFKLILGIVFLLLTVPAWAQETPLTAAELYEELQADSLAAGALEEEIPLNLVKNGSEGDVVALSGTAPERKISLSDLDEAARYDSLWMKELYEYASLFDDMYDEVTELPLDTVALEVKKVNTEELKERLDLLNQKTPFNIAYNASLENVINSFLVRRKDLMERMLTASQFYFPMFEEALDKYDLPLEIKYLAIVESALNPRARSRVGATGMWQFMYGTGKMYGLEVNSYIDERQDPIKATEAACRYLSRLYDVFGDWDLALAAYNSGPGNVNKAIRRSGGYTNYWNIRRNLPRETAGYLPAFLATMYIFEYAKEHDLKIRKVERALFETDTLHISKTITFEQISELVNVSQEELAMLNPAYKLSIIPKINGKTSILRLPKHAIGTFVTNEAAIYAHVEEELKKKEAPLPQLVAEEHIRYRVKSGDYLGRIAQQFGVGVSEIKRWNGLRSNMLRVGQRLTIYQRGAVGASAKPANQTAASGNGNTDARVHVVKEGDSLWTISKKYPGITVENLREWNGLSGSNLRPGTRLKLCNCSS